MLKKYKNQLHEDIRQMGLNPELFAATEQDNGKTFILRVKYSPLKFTFTQTDTTFHDFRCEYTKYSPKFSDQYLPNKTINFNDARTIFKHWLETHVRLHVEEMEAPDLWEEMSSGSSFMGQHPVEEENYTNFSVKEKVLLRHTLEKIKNRMNEEFKPSKKEVIVIEKRLGYLSETLDRVNRYDLKGLLLLTISNIASELRFDNNESKSLLEIVKEEFSGVEFLQQ